MTRRQLYHERLYIVIIVIVSYSEKRETHTALPFFYFEFYARFKHSDKNVLEESLAGCDYPLSGLAFYTDFLLN